MNKFIFFISLFVSLSVKSAVLKLDWEDLKPVIKNAEVVLPVLTIAQLNTIKQLYQLERYGSIDDKKNVQKLKDDLAKQGINVAEVFKTRDAYMKLAQQKAENLNPKVMGKKIRMSGFLVPLEFQNVYDTVQVTEFLFVPFAGAGVHQPPPASNQIVRLSYSKGFTVENIQYPVWIEGTIQAYQQTEEVSLADGKVNLTMGYKMDGAMIDRYYPK
ncbi:DUF3299 domain-containing protein [Moritella sp. F3]|uniref:DUF3299 domain-containing protein n=1 Tax=Moritella sp. F3 TaxID=2718882 RepID=UPI0018E18C1E|nr:DUF3299 domain-containing protein [Moritella sp. F3]GIC76635.1 hypothetical protein FMO001_13620 [Moritella sp. F1]GIC81612.1 hypothetical protein FMO003_18930 [Moritella sp. F3]